MKGATHLRIARATSWAQGVVSILIGFALTMTPNPIVPSVVALRAGGALTVLGGLAMVGVAAIWNRIPRIHLTVTLVEIWLTVAMGIAALPIFIIELALSIPVQLGLFRAKPKVAFDPPPPPAP